MKKQKRVLTGIFVTIFALLFALSFYEILHIYYQYKTEKDAFSELVSEVSIPVITADTETSQPDTTEPEPTVLHKHDFQMLKEKNSECAAWISVPGSTIDYLVMHTPDDPEKYLRKNFERKYSISGTPFLDYRCSLESNNLITYGHHMKDGSMYADLCGYADKAFCDTHPVIEWETEAGVRYYSVYAAAKVKKTDDWYSFIDADTEDIFQHRIKDLNGKEYYTTDVTPQYGDRLLTLSTCYGSSKDDRLIVIAVETKRLFEIVK